MELTHVAGGFRHSVVATADGQVFGFGNNRYGELGMGDARTEEGRPLLRVPSPRPVSRSSWASSSSRTEPPELYG